MAKIAVIIGSTRAARFAETPATWIYELARKHESWEVELVDIRDFELPFFNELASNARVPSPGSLAEKDRRVRRLYFRDSGV